MPVVSVDLAYRHYRDIGVAVLRATQKAIAVQFVKVPLVGDPNPDALAEYLVTIASSVGANLLLIDGPQGWKDPNNGLLHSRVCERDLNTPAKTGTLGNVKPANYRAFVSFSIRVFDALTQRGWPRLASRMNPQTPTTIESFPLSAWRSLRLAALPAKAKTRPTTIAAHLAALQVRFPIQVGATPNHDELQALVSGLAGIALELGQLRSVSFTGESPFVFDGHYQEGLIVNPCLPYALSNAGSNPYIQSRRAQGHG